MICGKRVLRYCNILKEQNKRISNLLSAKWNETAAGTEKIYQELQDARFRLVGMEYEKIQKMAEELKDRGDQLIFEEGMNTDCLRKMAAEIMETCGGLCAVFCGNDKEGYRYAIGEKNGDLRDMIKQMNQELSGRGGGKPFFVQGSVAAGKEKIENFFKTARG